MPLPDLPLDFQLPPAWRELEEADLRGTLMLVGAADSGKSVLTRWLWDRALACGRRPAWLDADVGQSSLGIPGTLNLVLAGQEGLVHCGFFIGNSSPKGHMLPVLTGLARLCRRARSLGADPLLIDTSGLVDAASGGGALKQWEAELLAPLKLVALQRERELGHLLGPWLRDPRLRLRLLPVSEGVRRRDPEQRARRRSRLFARYFEGAAPFSVSLRQLAIYGWDQAQPGSLAGLIDGEGLLLRAALVRGRTDESLELLGPIPSLAGAAALRIGRLRLDPRTGEELRG